MVLKRIVPKYRQRFIDALSSELSNKKIALTFALAVPIGIVPFFCGLNILLSIVVAWKFKLNHLLIQLINNSVYPLQILLYLPFMKIGVGCLTADAVEFSPELLLAAFSEDFLGTVKMLGVWNIYALASWLLLSLPLAVTVYYGALFIAGRLRPAQLPGEAHGNPAEMVEADDEESVESLEGEECMASVV